MLIQQQTHVEIWLGLALNKYKKSIKAQTVWETQVAHMAFHRESRMVKRTRIGALRILIRLHEKSMRDVMCQPYHSTMLLRRKADEYFFIRCVPI